MLYNIGKNPLIWEQHPEHDRWKEEKFKIYFDKGIKNISDEFGCSKKDKIKFVLNIIKIVLFLVYFSRILVLFSVLKLFIH